MGISVNSKFIQEVAKENHISHDLATTYAHRIAGRRREADPSYGLNSLRSEINHSIRVANRLGLDPIRSREVIRIADYVSGKFEHFAHPYYKDDGAIVSRIVRASHEASQKASRPILQHLQFPDYSEFIQTAQGLGLGFPPERPWKQNRIVWSHEQRGVLNQSSEVRAVIIANIERSIVERYTAALTDSEWQGSLKMTDEQAKAWTQIFKEKRLAVVAKCKAALAGKDFDTSLPTWDELDSKGKMLYPQFQYGRLSDDTLAQVIAALPRDPDARAYARITRFLGVTLGKETTQRILDKAVEYAKSYDQSASRDQARKQKIQEKGNEIFRILRSERFSTQQIAEVATRFWAGQMNPHTAITEDTSMVAQGLMMMARHLNRRDVTALDNFKVALVAYISKELDSGRVVELSTDYHPEGMLGKLASTHNVNSSHFPEKTRMMISPSCNNRLAITVEQFDPFRYILPLSSETFRSSDAEELKQYRNILGVNR